MLIKNWAVGMRNEGEYSLPSACLTGAVYSHPSYEDGYVISTSPIVKIRKVGNIAIVTTRSGSIYFITAEGVNPDYEKSYPYAFDRLPVTEA